MLAMLADEDAGKICLVLDLDETLVHSSFRPIPNPDFIIPVEIEGKIVDVYVLKRPHMDHFMAHVGQRFEVVVFTASLSKYAGAYLQAPANKSLCLGSVAAVVSKYIRRRFTCHTRQSLHTSCR